MQRTALILAAGKGTRMRSSLAKVLHPVLGRPMVAWSVEACQKAGMDVVVVVNHQEERVREALAAEGVGFARQAVPRGTGDAVRSGVEAIPGDGVLVVLPGDAPLIATATLELLVEGHQAGNSLVTVLTAELEDAGAFGRILRDGEGLPVAIVEADECSPEQLAIGEFNSGIYAFDLAWLRTVLPGLKPHPPKGEIYITDTLELAASLGRSAVVVMDEPDELFGVNDRVSLSHVTALLQREVLAAGARGGVSFEHAASVVMHPEVVLGQDVTVGAACVLRGASRVGEGTTLGVGVVLEGATIGAGCQIGAYSVLSGAVVPPDTVLPPHSVQGAARAQ